jgi:hypothetical protein
MPLRASEKSTTSYRLLSCPISLSVDEHRGKSRRSSLRCSPDSPSCQGSFDYGPPVHGRAADYHRTPTPFHSIYGPLRLFQPDLDFYRPSRTVRAPRDNGRRRDVVGYREGDLYRPSKADTPQRSPPGCRNTRNTLTSPQNSTSDTTPRTIDHVIANFEKTHPKVQAQMDATKKVSKPHWHAADPYHPVQSRQQEHRHLNNLQEYSMWSKEQLLREANIRHLSYEHENVAYLNEIMVVNDRVLFVGWENFKHLSISRLLEEARYETLSIDNSKHWGQRPLLTLIAEMLGRVAVLRHNDLLRAEQLAGQTPQARADATAMADRPSSGNHPSKAHMISQQIKAMGNGTEATIGLSSGSAGKTRKQTVMVVKIAAPAVLPPISNLQRRFPRSMRTIKMMRAQ